MMQAILNIDFNQIPVEFEPTKLATKLEYVLIGGESDGDFHSRRNTFGRWLFGLPKKRIEPIGRFPVPPKNVGLSLKVKIEDLNIFKEWMHRGLCGMKSDCEIYADDKIYTFIGVFPIEWSDGGNVKLLYDYYTHDSFNGKM